MVTKNSNARMRITNIFDPTIWSRSKGADDVIPRDSVKISDADGCQGTVLPPGDLCALDGFFDTAEKGADVKEDFGISGWLSHAERVRTQLRIES